MSSASPQLQGAPSTLPLRTLSLRRGASLTAEQFPSATLARVLTGRVRAHRGADGEARNLLQLAAPGEVVGPFEPLEGGRSWQVTAEEESTVALVALADLPQLCRAAPEEAAAFTLGLARSHADAMTRLRGFAVQEVPARVAQAVVDLSRRLGVAEPDGRRSVSGLTQQDLADLVGASRTFVSTVVNDLRRQGLLHGAPRTLAIADAEAVQRLSAQE